MPHITLHHVIGLFIYLFIYLNGEWGMDTNVRLCTGQKLFNFEKNLISLSVMKKEKINSAYLYKSIAIQTSTDRRLIQAMLLKKIIYQMPRNIVGVLDFMQKNHQRAAIDPQPAAVSVFDQQIIIMNYETAKGFSLQKQIEIDEKNRRNLSIYICISKFLYLGLYLSISKEKIFTHIQFFYILEVLISFGVVLIQHEQTSGVKSYQQKLWIPLLRKLRFARLQTFFLLPSPSFHCLFLPVCYKCR